MPWRKNEKMGNYVYSKKRFYLSYSEQMNETAVVICKKNSDPSSCAFFILLGDWRKQYEKVMRGKVYVNARDACLDFYHSQAKEHRSPHSD